ncbi:hypothetical protein AQJ23_16355 [Streptomyces antibioticus]|nr:hypothetical protein AQJ23_16355 [Streptomyces antibioticus]
MHVLQWVGLAQLADAQIGDAAQGAQDVDVSVQDVRVQAEPGSRLHLLRQRLHSRPPDHC